MKHQILAACVPLLLILGTALPALAQGNGGFENGLTGWTAEPPGNLTLASPPIPAGLFPTEGDTYAVLRSNGLGDAAPGYGPHPTGSSPFGPDGQADTGDGFVSKLSRAFTRPVGARCVVSIDWNFFQDEGRNEIDFNDFLSIDVIDVATGDLVQNLVFVDTGTLGGSPAYNNIPGGGVGTLAYVEAPMPAPGNFEIAPAGPKHAEGDISFSTVPGQALRLEISVGNVDDSSVPCVVRVDNFRVYGGHAPLFGMAGLRVLGSAQVDGLNSPSDNGSTEYSPRFIRHTLPGEPIVLRPEAPPGNLPGRWALLLGEPTEDAPDFGFGPLPLDQATISVAFDGINPPSLGDAILGSIGPSPNFINAVTPMTATSGRIGLQGIMVDVSNGPFFLETTPLTELHFNDYAAVPRGDTPVLNSGGQLLGLDDTGVVDLSPIGGFDFYGVNYTELHVCSNGFLTFGGADTAFVEDVADFQTGLPRIAVLWDDLDRPFSGFINYGIDAMQDIVTISWIDVAEFPGQGEGSAVNMSVQLFPDGTISCYYDSLTNPDGLVGISPGGIVGPSVNAGVNFSVRGGYHQGAATLIDDDQAIWQVFRDPSVFGASLTAPVGIDLNDIETLGGNAPARITYTPRESGGYRVFCGSR